MLQTPKLIATLFLIGVFALQSFSQNTPYLAQIQTEFKDPVNGVEFNVPFGWVAFPIDGGYMVQSNTVEGCIMVLLTEPQSYKNLRTANNMFIQSPNRGIELTRNSDFVKFGKKGVEASYQGIFAWQPARCNVISIASNYGAVHIIAGCLLKRNGNLIKAKARELAQSMKLSAPKSEMRMLGAN